MNNYKLVKYDNNGVNIDIRLDEGNNTIWLTQSEIALIFNTSKDAIKKSIRRISLEAKNISCGDSQSPTYEFDSQVQTEGTREINRKVKLYNLVMIEEISKRSKSNSGYDFIKWANDILKSNSNLSIAEFSPNETIKSKIYDVRNTKVMLDFELAELYGYETFRFNEQVKNNIEKFPSDFMFRLSEDEVNKILISKKSMSSWGGRRTLPYAFTEQGIYMLMTVLKGELATTQSIMIIRAFKSMKDYIISSNNLISTNEIIKLTNTVYDNSKKINYLLTSDKEVREKLEIVMDNFIDPSTYKEYLILDGKRVEADVTYQSLYQKAKNCIYIIDDYIDIKTLLLLKVIDKNISLTIISDNLSKNNLTKRIYNDFVNDTNININFITNNKKFHDRYIIIDFNTNNEIIYNSGASIKDGGNKIATIKQLEYPEVYHELINDVLKNPALILK